MLRKIGFTCFASAALVLLAMGARDGVLALSALLAALPMTAAGMCLILD